MFVDEVGDFAGADTVTGDGEERQLDPALDELRGSKRGGEVFTKVTRTSFEELDELNRREGGPQVVERLAVERVRG